MSDADVQTVEPIRFALWNPNAAANWSLLLSPAFGAYLHAANWRTIGKPERAMVNMIWFWAVLVFLAINLGTVFLPDSKAIEAVMRLGGLGLLLGWYFTQGKSQARYVTETLRDDYVKKGWGSPLLIGLAAVGAYIGVLFFLAVAAYNPGPDELAAQVQPLILMEWQKNPELQGASIQNVSLTHQGGKVYTGSVHATLGGRPAQLSLKVEYERGTISWEVKPMERK